MYDEKDMLLQEFFDLEEGESRAGELCPACTGGRTGERTLSVSKVNGKIVWLCHRDSCGFKGTQGYYSRARTKTATSVRPTTARGTGGRFIVSKAEKIPDEARAYLKARYAICEHHISKHKLGWDTETDRLILPVYTRTGELSGCTLRSLSGATPKSLTHVDEDSIAWYTNAHQNGIIIVEDQLSAIRASDYLTSVALLGTHLNENRVALLRAANTNPIYLALDNDAVATAVRHMIKYRSFLKVRMLRLAKDIKDMTHEEADSLFSNIDISRVR